MSLTSGVFLAYLAHLGYSADTMAGVAMLSSPLTLLLGLAAYRRPEKALSRPRALLLAAHAGERLVWFVVPFIRRFELLAALYFVKDVLSALVSLVLGALIFGLFDERGVREVTAKRGSAASLSSIVGYLLATALLSRGEEGFALSFIYGGLVGLASTALMAVPRLGELRVEVGELKGVERVYTASLYQALYSASTSLLSVLWVSAIVGGLGLSEYWVTAVSLVGTAVSVFASLAWGRAEFRYYRLSLAFESLTPILVLAANSPLLHLGLAAYYSFFSTGAGFLGSFLYARYIEGLGAVRASSLLILLGSAGEALGLVLGILFGKDPLALAATIAALKAASLAVAFLAIPEVAVVPEYAARSYASTLYSISLLGFNLTLEVSKEAVLTTLRALALTVSLMFLYLIYRISLLLAGL